MNVTYREACFDDIYGMLKLLKQLFAIEKDFTYDEVKHTKGISLLLDDSESFVLVAEIDGHIAGMGTLQKRISTVSGCQSGILEDIVVDKNYRGKGIGNGIIEILLDQAMKMKMSTVTLAADKDNHTALRFYQNRGFNTTNLIYLARKLDE
jgi:ribosomal protein S18 acetylase RimI-like enzyme